MFKSGGKIKIQADVIVLGCTLPGIVAAYKLKSRFGDALNIVVLDFQGHSTKTMTKHVDFVDPWDLDDDGQATTDYTVELFDDVTKLYLMQYAKEFELPLPESIINPERDLDKTPTIYPESIINPERGLDKTPTINPESIINPESRLDKTSTINPESIINPERGLDKTPTINSASIINPERGLDKTPTINPESTINPERGLDKTPTINPASIINPERGLDKTPTLNPASIINPERGLDKTPTINPESIINPESRLDKTPTKNPESTINPDRGLDKTPTINPEDSELEAYPQEVLKRIQLQKLFQYANGSTVQFLNNVHDFEYLNFFEKFELNQYQKFLDSSMRDLFFTINSENDSSETNILLSYDQTTMEKNICGALLFPTSREIMRIIVKLVCGAPANRVSLLFYLYQCFRTSSTKNHLGGINIRFREKLIGQCKRRLASKLRSSIADNIMMSKPIIGIRTISQQVILETRKGETTYICNLLVMALTPDQLTTIQVDNRLLSEENRKIASCLKPGRAIKFNIQYTENFWSRQGYSGDIFSMRGPIIWAMEKPVLSTTGSLGKYSGLIGYLMVHDNHRECKEAVLEQLVDMFGSEAADPVSYKETPVNDVYVPCCGDYVALRRWTRTGNTEFLEWGALDIFADGDLGSALEAGHSAYLHLMACLRPQALLYEDYILYELPIHAKSRIYVWMSHFNLVNSLKITVCAAAVYIAVKFLRISHKSK